MALFFPPVNCGQSLGLSPRDPLGLGSPRKEVTWEMGQEVVGGDEAEQRYASGLEI